jgi:lysophospholipase L1-like esterase
MTLVCVGDSTTANNIDTRQNSWPTFMAEALTQLRIPALSKSIFGSGNNSSPTRAAYMTYNPEVTMDTDWGFSGSVRSVGGPVFQNTTGTGVLSWAIPGNVDTIKIFYLNGNTGSFTWQVDAGATTQIDTVNSIHTFETDTISVALGSHALNIARVSGTANFIGAYAYDSTASAIDILNVGIGGFSTTGYADTGFPWRPGAALPGLEGDLYLVNLGINDDIASTALATVEANLNIIAGECLEAGDCWMVRPTPIITSNVDYTQAYIDVAKDNGCTYLDMKTMFDGSYANALADGLMADGNHPDVDGNALIGGTVARMLAGF